MQPRPGPQRKPPPAGWRRHWPWLAVAAVSLALLLALLREPLGERLWPQARIDRLLAEGDRALAEGRLDQADGQGARQKYEAAQALDSDRGEARTGLARVGQAALVHARAAIEGGRLDEARRWVALAGELQLPRAQVDAVAGRLRQAELAGVDLGALRGQAQAALAAGDAEVALPLFAQWLAIAPDDTAALEGREDALSLLLERVPQALHEGDLAAAARWLELARRADPGHMELPDLRAAYAQALAGQVRQAERALRRGRLEDAADRYLRLRELAPEEAAVTEGVQRTALALAARARQRAADFRFDAAEDALAQARQLAPTAGEVAEAARDLERARAAEARLHAPAMPARTSATALRRELEGFEQAVQRGDWIEPPGTSAYDRLRAAQALAPQDPAVRAAAARMQAAAASCVEQELRDNRLRTAQGCHDAWQALAPSDPGLAVARQRLAQRWLAVGEERLRAGELGVAVRALAAARALDPAAAGLEDFAVRLERARSGAP
ncbi:hypothetical protein [Pseudoxanthomonas suwonensis]|uniref:Uncharacterized protein n=1 Tax=Pseudoxanthomonas suwonensis TaxID=314722 RepID=A0A0E3UML0_9GAMM|nr:hypothetical protein [Pseudoxanthomonas suwonensis]AKC86130.1 hypothetical protein WQ53_04425 [Pseudoxanthomonas suwonensis]